MLINTSGQGDQQHLTDTHSLSAFSAVQLKNAESLVYRETHSQVLQTLFKENNLFVGTVYNDCLVTPNNVHLSKQSFYTLTNSDNNFISFVNSFSGIQSNFP